MGLKFGPCVLYVIGLASAVLARTLNDADVVSLESNLTSKREYLAERMHMAIIGDEISLDLCECEPASGSPNGLTCEKEGWFISNFEQAGQWSNGGGWVPLSRAICCRPCLPESIPGASKAAAVALISTGCHPSSNRGPDVLQCESTGGSFITGWSEALRIPDARQYYYPVGAVQCCTPSILLSNGDARPLERCDCVQSDDVNCGGTDSHRLLSGWTRWGGDRSLVLPPQNSLVPIAPAVCCKSCISDTVIPAGSCFDLNYCSGHGSCNLGTCDCVAGYGGADCSHRVQLDPSGLSQFAIAMIVLSSVAVALLMLIIVVRVGQYCSEEVGEGEEDGAEDDEDLREPLIAGLASDDEGSVGSEDSSDGDEDELMPPPLSRRAPPVEAVGGGIPVTPEEQLAAGQALNQQESQSQPPQNPQTGSETSEAQSEALEAAEEARDHASESDEGEHDEYEEAQNAANVQADDTTIESIRQAQPNSTAIDGSDSKEKAGKEEKDRGGLPGVVCSVCLNRPVQVAVVPCGHMCLCRRCSRRLHTCPVCRLRILRRQRVFLGG